MRGLRCLVGRHDWTNQVPDGVTPRHDVNRAFCARCGARAAVDTNRVRRPPARNSMLDNGTRQDPDRPWSWGM